MGLHELDLVNIVGLIIALLIILTGLYRRQRAKKLQASVKQSDIDARSGLSLPSSNANVLTNAGNRNPNTSSSSSSAAAASIKSSHRLSPSPTTEARRRQPSGSPLCSGCQCSMTRCQCTIVLYRPATTSGNTTPTSERSAESVNDKSTGSPRATSYLSPTSNFNVSSRRSSSRDRTVTERSRSPSGDRFLSVPRSRSRTSLSSTTPSGSVVREKKLPDERERGIFEINSNSVSFKSKVA